MSQQLVTLKYALLELPSYENVKEKIPDFGSFDEANKFFGGENPTIRVEMKDQTVYEFMRTGPNTFFVKRSGGYKQEFLKSIFYYSKEGDVVVEKFSSVNDINDFLYDKRFDIVGITLYRKVGNDWYETVVPQAK